MEFSQVRAAALAMAETAVGVVEAVTVERDRLEWLMHHAIDEREFYGLKRRFDALADAVDNAKFVKDAAVAIAEVG